MTNAEQIYLQYHDKVRAYVRGKVRDPHDVEDLVSAVFMKIVQKLDSYDSAKASVSETRVGLAFKDVRCAEAQLVERFGQNFADA